jgi:coenzyme F420-reducing hydrogenase gamma subunit
MKYLGIDIKKPKVAVFDFSGCEGCELQLANKERSLVDFLKSIEIVNYREVSSIKGQDYDVALVDGAITRSDEVEKLKRIRAQAKVLVALGSCACFGGVNKLKNAYDLDEANREVYPGKPKETQKTRAVEEAVPVDLKIPGCPVSKAEVERVILHLIMQVAYQFPVYPVCVECKQRFTVCQFDKGQLCLGPITLGGCDAPCPAGGLGCWGCRGPAPEANFEEFFNIVKEHGFDKDLVNERLSFFGGFEVRL